jgi:ubiquinone/menaquinone biosynthesis C-methylase UbiE
MGRGSRPTVRWKKGRAAERLIRPATLNSMRKEAPLYGPQQSLFARYLERQERRRPDPIARELRRRLLEGLRGRVIELGCGDGRAFEHYPSDVESVLAVEPDPMARAAAAERAREARVPIEVVDGVADALPAEDGAFDAAVIIWVLCSVPDPAAALRELHRVLAVGGELRFYEHVRSEHAALRVLQRAVDALVWTRALGGCETTRDTETAIVQGSFQIVKLERGFHSSSVLAITSAPYIFGTARRQ